MKAIFLEQPGEPEAMRFTERPAPEPGPGEVLVKLAYSGVNYTDINQRSGANKIPLPAILGSEGAGTVERVGAGVSDFAPGDRVAYAMTRGSYAEYAAVPAKMLARVPAGIELRDAAAAMLQGMTAHYLTHASFPLQPGQTALVHAAAGGTGRLLVQMAVKRGARVIATAGTPEKAQAAREAGAGNALLYDTVDWVAETKRLTGGQGVDVVYDAIGRTTFLKGLDCLKPRGMMVHYGMASGPVEPIDTRILTQKGSLFLTRPSLGHHITGPGELAGRAGDVFRWIADGSLKLSVYREYALAEAAQSHRDLESRKTSGKLLLRI